MDKINPFEDTKAFVEMVKLSNIEPDLKQIAVFFPDALLIEDEDYKDPEFGKGLFCLMHTDPYRFSRIVECHVNNYNVLGYRLIKENQAPEGKLVGMFILSIAVKNAGIELFNEIPRPEYFRAVIDTLKHIKLDEIDRALKSIEPPQGVKEEFKELLTPYFYWQEYRRSLEELKGEYVWAFLAHLNSILSAFFLISFHQSAKSSQKKESNVIQLQGNVGEVTLKYSNS